MHDSTVANSLRQWVRKAGGCTTMIDFRANTKIEQPAISCLVDAVATLYSKDYSHGDSCSQYTAATRDHCAEEEKSLFVEL